MAEVALLEGAADDLAARVQNSAAVGWAAEVQEPQVHYHFY